METFFTVTAPGLRGVAIQEMRSLGLLPRDRRAAGPDWRLPAEESGGITFEGELPDLYRANLHLRTASRVLVRLGELRAVAFAELRKKASRLPWERFLAPGQPVQMHVTAHRSRLYHSDAVAERVAGAISDRLGQPSELVKAVDGEALAPPQMVVVRLDHDLCTVSVDSSGELLHRRGYRQETAKAPLRENLAAALLMAAKWDRSSPLLDPFCGSGTIAIEAALMALGLPPGRDRRFAFMSWPGYRPEQWQALQQSAQQAAPPASPLILQASDRDAGAIRIAQANAERAGVSQWIEFSVRAVSAIEPPPGPGWVVTNPPYGLRVSAGKDLRNLYARLGQVLQARCPGWRVAILSSDLALLAQTGLPLETTFSTVNGGVSVRLGRGVVPDGS